MLLPLVRCDESQLLDLFLMFSFLDLLDTANEQVKREEVVARCDRGETSLM